MEKSLRPKVISYEARCFNCNVLNRLPLTNQDIPREQVKLAIFECGGCGARTLFYD